MAISDILARLKSRLHGTLVEPGDSEYEEARKVYNGMIDRRPRAIARCADAADVSAAVQAGREAGLRIAVRGGAHNGAGLGVCDDGLVVDLSGIRTVQVDAGA